MCMKIGRGEYLCPIHMNTTAVYRSVCVKMLQHVRVLKVFQCVEVCVCVSVGRVVVHGGQLRPRLTLPNLTQPCSTPYQTLPNHTKPYHRTAKGTQGVSAPLQGPTLLSLH